MTQDNVKLQLVWAGRSVLVLATFLFLSFPHQKKASGEHQETEDCSKIEFHSNFCRLLEGLGVKGPPGGQPPAQSKSVHTPRTTCSEPNRLVQSLLRPLLMHLFNI